MSKDDIAPIITDPNYINANHDASVLSAIVIWSVLATIAMALRLASKRVGQARLGIDDMLLVISYVVCMAQSIMIGIALKFGLGRHALTLTAEDSVSFAKAFFASGLLQPTTLTAAKLSIIVLFHRLFIVRSFRTAVRILGIILVLWYIAHIICQLLICQPISSQWTGATENCRDQHLLLIVTPIPWVITDFAILIAPIPILKNLQLARDKKLGVIMLFLMGGVTCILTVLRYRSLFYTNKDPTYDIATLAIWQITEANVTLVCASLLAAGPAILYLWPKKLISETRSAWIHYKKSSKITMSGTGREQNNMDSSNPLGSVTNLHRQSVAKSNPQTSIVSTHDNDDFELEYLKNTSAVGTCEISTTTSNRLKNIEAFHGNAEGWSRLHP